MIRASGIVMSSIVKEQYVVLCRSLGCHNIHYAVSSVRARILWRHLTDRLRYPFLPEIFIVHDKDENNGQEVKQKARDYSP